MAPREHHYRDYNIFHANNFKTELKQNLVTSSNIYENFEQAFLALLDKYARYKSKKMRANQVPHMTKNLRKKSRLKTKYFKANTAESLQSYTKQNNFRSKLYEKERKKERSFIIA